MKSHIDSIPRTSLILALDCEWLPDGMRVFADKEEWGGIAILQIGAEDTRDGGRTAYVVRVGKVEREGLEGWVVAFGFQQDIFKLHALFPSLAQKELRNMKDLENTQGVKDSHGVLFTGKRRKGLGDLAYHCLGVRLDKSCRLCNWEREPLRPAQVRYAANDVLVLLDINAVLRKDRGLMRGAKAAGNTH
ncbi:Exonuclease mut-7 [Irineochytrium annulatum]|nr:Exonuclease mut-7 [Irineochytrium annulatum]